MRKIASELIMRIIRNNKIKECKLHLSVKVIVSNSSDLYSSEISNFSLIIADAFTSIVLIENERTTQIVIGKTNSLRK